MAEMNRITKAGNSASVIGQVGALLARENKHELFDSYHEEAKNCAGYFDFINYTEHFCAVHGIQVEFIQT